MELILNMRFVTLNEYINTERSNRYKAAKIKEQQTNSVAFLAKEQNLKLNKDNKYDVHFIWYKPNNRIDHDNISFCKKFVLDGLKLAGSIKDDSPKYINNFTDSFRIDETRSYISCVVRFLCVI